MFQYWVGAKIDPDASSEGVEVDLSSVAMPPAPNVTVS